MFYSSVNAQPLGINMIFIFWKETVVPGERVAAIFTTDYVSGIFQSASFILFHFALPTTPQINAHYSIFPFTH